MHQFYIEDLLSCLQIWLKVVGFLLFLEISYMIMVYRHDLLMQQQKII